jgi:hypothetical protein
MEATIDYINLTFTCLFILEAAAKIMAWGGLYFHDKGNKFDFIIVMISVVELVVTPFAGTEQLEIITLFRIFRVGRILRLIKSAKSLRVIFATFYISLP